MVLNDMRKAKKLLKKYRYQGPDLICLNLTAKASYQHQNFEIKLCTGWGLVLVPRHLHWNCREGIFAASTGGVITASNIVKSCKSCESRSETLDPLIPIIYVYGIISFLLGKPPHLEDCMFPVLFSSYSTRAENIVHCHVKLAECFFNQRRFIY